MEGIWLYIVCLLVGFSGGLLVAVRVSGDEYSAYIKRIKQKGKKGSTQEVIFEPIVTSDEEKISNWKARRNERLKKRLLN